MSDSSSRPETATRHPALAAVVGGLLATVLYVALMVAVVVGLYWFMPTDRLRLGAGGDLVQTKLTLLQFAQELPSRLAWHVWVGVAAGWVGCVLAGIRFAVFRAGIPIK
jgi:hypothetical protein